MEDFEAEIRGRMVMMQTLIGVMLAQVAATTSNPDALIRNVMANVEQMIETNAQRAGDDDKRAAEYSRAAFDELSDAMLRHLVQRTTPAGRG